MKIIIVLLCCVQLTQTETHSLQYFYTAVKEIHFPEFIAVGFLDREEFTYYDSQIKSKIPKTEWIKKITGDNPDYWRRFTQILQGSEETFKVNLDTIMQRFNHTGGVHTVQYMYGCELDDDGTTRGYRQYGYDGEDFISLDLKTLTWTAANQKAVITKQRWDSDQGFNQNNNHYLKNECIDWLKKYVSYGRETLERRVRPEAELFQKSSSSPELVCHATGFFPKAVMMTWQKNGVEQDEDVEIRETLPNQDGSFQKRIILRVSPEDQRENKYTCVIQHGSLEKDLSVKEIRIIKVDGAPIGPIVGGVVGLLVVVVGGILRWKKKKNSGYKPASTGSDTIPSNSECTSEKPTIRDDLVEQPPVQDQIPESELDFDKWSDDSGLSRSPSESSSSSASSSGSDTPLLKIKKVM